MTNFLIQEIAHHKRLDVAAVDLHEIPWSNPVVLHDDKSCKNCKQRHPRIWASCNKENLILSSELDLTILDYELIVEDYYKDRYCETMSLSDWMRLFDAIDWSN